MFSFLTTLEVDVLIAVVSAGLGAAFKTKIVDFVKGVPSELRAALNGTEQSALNAITAAKVDAIAKVTGIKVASPAAAPAPTVVVAATPAAAAAAPAIAAAAVAAEPVKS